VQNTCFQTGGSQKLFSDGLPVRDLEGAGPSGGLDVWSRDYIRSFDGVCV